MQLVLWMLLMTGFANREAAGEPGFEFRVSHGEAVVTRGADGVEQGWRIVRIGSQKVEGLMERARGAAESEGEARAVAYALVLHRMSGERGDTKTITFGRGDGTFVTCEVKLRRRLLD